MIAAACRQLCASDHTQWVIRFLFLPFFPTSFWSAISYTSPIHMKLGRLEAPHVWFKWSSFTGWSGQIIQPFATWVSSHILFEPQWSLLAAIFQPFITIVYTLFLLEMSILYIYHCFQAYSCFQLIILHFTYTCIFFKTVSTVIQWSSYCCLYTCKFHKMNISVLKSHSFTTWVWKPEDVTHRYCFTPYQCTAATSIYYSSLNFHSE